MQSPVEQVLPSFASSEYKNIFESKTFWGAVSTAILAISPAVNDMIVEFLRTGKISPITIFRISLLLASTTLTVVGRVTAQTPVYTPNGLPGPDRVEFSQSKSIFESKTFWGAVSTAIIAIAPAMNDLLSEFQKTGKINPASIFKISMLLVTTAFTIMGRITAETPVYTPPGLPGPNKPQS
ncbi:MAG: hypothetical protein KME60_02170 [Cyanomargarita calcarea GSE-NOS-MK-12-04C]|jgi:hypothetical protein|uniref:Uncharacterized protein n=1 Tax=Cyanomargarita calcarea GSE-NOS-MK-12-04C TaxID=2839659 RepID=A0A951QJR0_9CYAN|nr:hypothetical protein [Cyanomargarita calcarea GSE-NOS-MK-12-04C]